MFRFNFTLSKNNRKQTSHHFGQFIPTSGNPTSLKLSLDNLEWRKLSYLEN